MKKLVCDICNGALEMSAGGQGAVCTCCGMSYSVARLQEKLGVGAPAQAEEVVYEIPESDIEEVYEVTDFEVVEEPKHFWMAIENFFEIANRGVVVTGLVQDAPVHVNDPVTVIRADGYRIETKVLAIEHYHKLYDRIEPKAGVGILLENVKREHISVNDVLAATAEAKQSISDYYKIVTCPNCKTYYRIHNGAKKPLQQCLECNTPL